MAWSQPFRALVAADGGETLHAHDVALQALCRAEAAAGNPEAINNLGWMTLFGIGDAYRAEEDELDAVARYAQSQAGSDGGDEDDARVVDPFDLQRYASPFDVRRNARHALPLFAAARDAGSLAALNNCWVLRALRLDEPLCNDDTDDDGHHGMSVVRVPEPETVRDAVVRAAYDAFLSLAAQHPHVHAFRCNAARCHFLPLPPFVRDLPAALRTLQPTLTYGPAQLQLLKGVALPDAAAAAVDLRDVYAPALRMHGYAFGPGRIALPPLHGARTAALGLGLLEVAATLLGDTQAMGMLARAYAPPGAVDDAGWAPTGADERRRALWYERAVKAGDADAAFQVSVQHSSGHEWRSSVPADTHTLRACRTAANRGHALAQYNLSLAHMSGVGFGYNVLVHSDTPRALLWSRRAAASGHSKALRQLAWLCERAYTLDNARALGLRGSGLSSGSDGGGGATDPRALAAALVHADPLARGLQLLRAALQPGAHDPSELAAAELGCLHLNGRAEGDDVREFHERQQRAVVPYSYLPPGRRHFRAFRHELARLTAVRNAQTACTGADAKTAPRVPVPVEEAAPPSPRDIDVDGDADADGDGDGDSHGPVSSAVDCDSAGDDDDDERDDGDDDDDDDAEAPKRPSRRYADADVAAAAAAAGLNFAAFGSVKMIDAILADIDAAVREADADLSPLLLDDTLTTTTTGTTTAVAAAGAEAVAVPSGSGSRVPLIRPGARVSHAAAVPRHLLRAVECFRLAVQRDSSMRVPLRELSVGHADLFRFTGGAIAERSDE